MGATRADISSDDDLPLATAQSDIDVVEQLVWGMRHVDDLVLRRVNANHAGGADTDFSDAGDRAGDQFLNDLQFSVVAAVDVAGTLLERVEYDAYGQAQHHWPEGITGAAGGGVVSADATAASGAVGKSIGQTGYLSDADLDRSGTVTAAEASAVSAKVGTAGIPAGRISAYGSTVGWCGYRFNAGPNIETVRFRHYDPAPGVARWLERDPAGYMDGASLYAVLGGDPVIGGDAWGLAPFRWSPEEHHVIPQCLRDLPGLPPEWRALIDGRDNIVILPRIVHQDFHNVIDRGYVDAARELVIEAIEKRRTTPAEWERISSILRDRSASTLKHGIAAATRYRARNAAWRAARAAAGALFRQSTLFVLGAISVVGIASDAWAVGEFAVWSKEQLDGAAAQSMSDFRQGRRNFDEVNNAVFNNGGKGDRLDDLLERRGHGDAGDPANW